MRVAINAILLLAVAAGVIWLQIFLSKRESRWLGLLLPLLSLAYSLLMVLSVGVFGDMTAWEIFGLIVATFLIANVPTIILVAIYLACREKVKQKRALDKMNVQDLE